jgi:phospholipase/carboxylesterase
MNRLPTLLAPSAPFRQTATKKRRVQENPKLPIDFTHRLFFPTSFTPSYDYPLVVWLHSQRSSEYELQPVMQALSNQNYIGIAPRANIRTESKRNLFSWGHSREDYAYAEEAVFECIFSAIETLPIDSTRIFLAGFGAAGTLAQWIGLQYSERLAGVVSMSGPVPTMNGSLSNWKLARSLPFLYISRRGSSLCNEANDREAIRLVYRSGLRYTFWHLQSHEDSGAEPDELSTEMLAAANRYMMGIVLGQPISLTPEEKRDHLVGPFGLN